ncbi:hypothetical protein DPMN_121782 [Dreissena polymorpha]|uniref:Uncharacterized protein n=1 Tax=Dreissena polymorpha TaxID=45954 RepID=A0A9D4JTG5_DREPO|nr:hypothetical protein DPMN_121782 [Dreissena polymorpha]
MSPTIVVGDIKKIKVAQWICCPPRDWEVMDLIPRVEACLRSPPLSPSTDSSPRKQTRSLSNKPKAFDAIKLK